MTSSLSFFEQELNKYNNTIKKDNLRIKTKSIDKN